MLNYKEYALTGSAIEEVSQDLQSYLADMGCESKQTQRIRLTVEELLLRLREKSREDLIVNIAIGKRFGKHLFQMYYGGESIDPTSFEEEDEWELSIMPALGLAPSWNYSKGKNKVSLVLSERTSKGAVFSILLALAFAMGIGLLGRFIPAETTTLICDNLLTPLIDGFFGLLKTFAGIMIAFTTTSAIAGIGDSREFGKLGGRMLFRMLTSTLIICAISVVAAVFILGISFGGGEMSNQGGWSDIGEMIFGIIPMNLIDPFLQGNTLQIMVIAILIGIGFISVGDRAQHIKKLVEDGAALTQNIVSMITSLIYICVSLMLLKLFWSGEGRVLLTGWKPLLIIVSGEAILVIVTAIITGIKVRRSAVWLLKKAMPAFLVVFSSASSLSAMTLGMDICEKDMNVDKKTVGFSYPLAVVLYKASSGLTAALMVCAMAHIYNVEVSITWIITAIIMVTLLNIAMPPIAGAGVMVYTMLFAKLGIPADAIIMAAALETIIDHTDSGCNTLMMILKISQEGKPIKQNV